MKHYLEKIIFYIGAVEQCEPSVNGYNHSSFPPIGVDSFYGLII